jgi:hypothetical protein
MFWPFKVTTTHRVESLRLSSETLFWAVAGEEDGIEYLPSLLFHIFGIMKIYYKNIRDI